MSNTHAGCVLIHGSELGAWLWGRMVAELRSPALAVDLPGRGSRPADRRSVRLEDAVRSVVDDVQKWDVDRVVLIAHSFSGVLVPAVAEALGERVGAVVLVGATVPLEGKSWVDLLPLPQRLLLRGLYKIRQAGLLSPEGENRKTLCNDLDAETTAWFLERRVPEAPHFLLDPVSTATFPPEVPLHYVRLLSDRSVSDAVRERMIGAIPRLEVHDMEAGHLPMLSQPAKLAGLLDGIAATPI
ncbi:MAG: alpha/beta fold hydrolase [Pseudonocardiaceae bacterium]